VCVCVREREIEVSVYNGVMSLMCNWHVGNTIRYSHTHTNTHAQRILPQIEAVKLLMRQFLKANDKISAQL